MDASTEQAMYSLLSAVFQESLRRLREGIASTLGKGSLLTTTLGLTRGLRN